MNKIHIAVNTRLLLSKQLEGIGRFSYEVLKRWVLAHPEVQFSFLFDRPFDTKYIFAENVHPVVLFPPARHPILFIWWFEFSVYKWLEKHQPNLFFSPDGYLSLRSKVPQIAVIHDLAFEYDTGDIYYSHKMHYRTFFPKYAKKAKKILTVSEFSKQEIINKYGIDKKKCQVVYNGCDERFQPINEAEKKKIREKYSEGEEYYIYVGAIQPRKNIGNLLMAFDNLKAETKSTIKLLIVGRKAWKFKEIEDIYNQMNFQKDVIFTGYIDDEDLRKCYSAALALCYVSNYEGFGLPLLEAMHSETAIITSNVSSMPEVTKNAAILVDPNRVTSIAEGMKSLLENNELRFNLINKGKQRKLDFSWEKTAEIGWQSILDIINEN